MQRWIAILGCYDYKIKYIKSEDNPCDALSRLPETEGLSRFLFIQEEWPLDHKQIAKETKKANILNLIYGYCLHDWPRKEMLTDAFKSYYAKMDQLHLEQGCVLWSYRAVIPTSLRPKLLKEVYLTYMGVSKCKGLARYYF